MNKKMLVLLVMVVLAVGLLIVSWNLSGRQSASRKKQPEKAAAEKKVDEEAFWKETAQILEKAAALEVSGVYYRSVRRDPMQPPGSLQPFRLIIKEEPLVLSGIMLGSQGKAAAIVGERIVRVGDTVAGKKIMKIDRNRVILKKGPEEEILTLS